MPDSLHDYAAVVPDPATRNFLRAFLERWFPKATELTSSTADLGAMSSTEIGWLNGVTAGTVAASKAAVVDANKDVGDFRNVDVVNLDAGASGTAGTVDVFPGTAAKGKVAITAADSAGDTTTTITNASQAGARIYTIPDAGASASFAMTEGAQTLNGVQTYTSPRVADHNTGITAFATGGQASATALTGEWNNVTTCATAADSVKLPAAVAGQVITVKNSGATSLAVFPATGDAINALAANLSVDIAAGSEVTFRAIDATTWETCEVITLPAPTTQKGNLVFQAADSAGNTNTTITNASQAAARTYTIPDAGASASFVMTEGAATVAGAKSFTGAITTTNGVASGTARKVGGLVKASTNAADSVTAAASNNAFVAFAETYVIPANTINAGTVLKARAMVRVSNASGIDTLTVEARVGGTTIVATTAVDPGATTDLHILELEFTGRAAAGAAASCVASGRWITNTGGTIAHGTGLMGATNFATNGALTLDLRAKWSSSTANTACLLETLSAEVVG